MAARCGLCEQMHEHLLVTRPNPSLTRRTRKCEWNAFGQSPSGMATKFVGAVEVVKRCVACGNFEDQSIVDDSDVGTTFL